MTLVPLVLSAVLASNATGKTTVRTNPGTIVPIASKCKTLICGQDGQAVAHVYFDGSAIRDTKGNAWTMAGTVPQVARSGATPPGAGPFGTTAYYSLASPNVLQNPGSGTFSACAVWNVSVVDDYEMYLGCNQATTHNGWQVFSRSSGSVSFADPITVYAASGGSIPAGAITVACFGISGTTWYLKVNGGSTLTGTGTFTAAAGQPMTIGWRTDGLVTSAHSVVYEILVTTQSSATGANFNAWAAAVMAEVKKMTGLTAW